jgi:hypothetical protein
MEEVVLAVIGECAGYVSLCWDPRPTGVFDSQLAADAVDRAYTRVLSALEESRTAGFTYALALAREAVAAVPEVAHTMNGPVPYPVGMYRMDALAAIDGVAP